MQQANQIRTLHMRKDIFDISKCQIQRKETSLKIFHQISLKELVRNHFKDKNMQNQELEAGIDQEIRNGQLANNEGRFGVDWGVVKIKEGLNLEYWFKVISAAEEMEEMENKSVENVNDQVERRMNLIASVDDNEAIIIDNESTKSDKKSEEPKVVYTVDVEVAARLKLDDDIDR
jgi:hypothetical protein